MKTILPSVPAVQLPAVDLTQEPTLTEREREYDETRDKTSSIWKLSFGNDREDFWTMLFRNRRDAIDAMNESITDDYGVGPWVTEFLMDDLGCILYRESEEHGTKYEITLEPVF